MEHIRVLNLGAGVQSTMLYLMACENHPACSDIDYAIFADVGAEPQAVYDHMKWLQTLGGPPIITTSKGNIAKDLMAKESETERRRFAAIPAFTESGGMGRRQCTFEYKIAAIEQCIRREIVGLKYRQHFPKKKIHIHQFLGLSLDEPKRVERVAKRFEKNPWSSAYFPLFEEQISRADALVWLKGRVPHETPRSSCIICPFHSDKEWLAVRAVEKDWELACRVDDALRDPNCVANRGMHNKQYLHRSLRPLREVVFKTCNEEK